MGNAGGKMPKDKNSASAFDEVAERKKILDGIYPSKIVKGRQNKHIPGTKEFVQKREKMQSESSGSEPSILTADAQAIVDKYKGTGKVYPNRGSSFPREEIDLQEIIGQTWVISEKKYVDTHRVMVLYSTKGVHIVPVSDWEG
jgi:hypothetical protein